MGVAAEPVLFPMIELAARLAILESVTEAAAMVVATVPAVVVTSPVSAGIRAAGIVPDERSEALPVDATVASPNAVRAADCVVEPVPPCRIETGLGM